MSTAKQTDRGAQSKGQWYATLKRGRVYYLQDTRFEWNRPTAVTEEQMEHLKEHAVDLVTVEGESEHQGRQKFTFSQEAPEAEEEVPDPRAEKKDSALMAATRTRQR